MNTSSVSFSYRAGETVMLRFAVTDSDGVAANLFGATLRFYLARKVGSDPVASTEDSPPTADADFVSAADGTYTVTIEPEITAGLIGTYRFESWLEDSSGGVSEPSHGFITFAPSIAA